MSSSPPGRKKTKEEQPDTAAGTQGPGFQTVTNHKPKTEAHDAPTVELILSAHKNTPCTFYAGGFF